MVELIAAAGPDAQSRLNADLNLIAAIDEIVKYVLAHTNSTNGWIGPFRNEPGDQNGHGLWDPLNMLRTLFNYAQAHPERERQVARAAIAHLTEEAKLLATDPVYKWASTRWPTYVEIVQYVCDEFIPRFGDDQQVMPLGKEATKALLLNSAIMFRAKGKDWRQYYHNLFPKSDVPGWNTNDHGVNNAEGALRWPAVAFRMLTANKNSTSAGNETERREMDFVLSQMDTCE